MMSFDESMASGSASTENLEEIALLM